MTKTKLTVSAVVLSLLCLGLSSCGTLTAIQLIVDTTEAAIPVLEDAGVQVPIQVPVYVAAVADCIGNQTGQLTPAQIAAVVTCLTAQVVPNLTSLPPVVSAAIVNIANAVAKFIVQNTAPASTTTSQVQVNAAILSPGNQARLDTLRARAQVTAKKARALKGRR